jgi:hypothetical protein
MDKPGSWLLYDALRPFSHIRKGAGLLFPGVKEGWGERGLTRK